ncbi:MAG: 1,4-alpha-glucan branching protein GlgB [Bacillota bacterium]
MTKLLEPADLYLFNEGTHCYAHRCLGAHTEAWGACRFAVWAPHARAVSVVGDFNGWSEKAHPMEMQENSGVWAVRIPDVHAGERYKYAIQDRHGFWRLRADPFAVWSELRPATASLIRDISGYAWHDDAWMQDRIHRNAYASPMAVYEVHAGSWKLKPDGSFYSYAELCDTLVPYVVDMGFTHIEFLPLCEHPFDGSWGYQVTGYFSITSRYGTPEEFMQFVDCCHQNGIGVIMDWVPAHFPRDEHGLAWFDGTALFEHADPRRGEQPVWGTNVFDFEKPQVHSFLASSAVFLLDTYHLDGLRVDAVSSMLYLDYGREENAWLPNEQGGRENHHAVRFLKFLNAAVHEKCGGALMFAEEASAYASITRKSIGQESVGFDYKWNMGWMNDILDYMRTDPIYRSGKHNRLTFSMTYAFSEDYLLPLSHDEVVHGKLSLLNKMPGAYEHKFANLRLLLGYMFAHPGKKLLFMGAEIAQFIEWDEKRELDWFLLDYDLHRAMQKYVRALCRFYTGAPPLFESDGGWDGFEWCSVDDYESSVLTFMRYADKKENALLCAFNFTPVPREEYRTGVPLAGTYTRVFHSDLKDFGGSGLEAAESVDSEDMPLGGFMQSLALRLPPLSATFYSVNTRKSI